MHKGELVVSISEEGKLIIAGFSQAFLVFIRYEY